MAKTLTCVFVGVAICFGVGCLERPGGRQTDSSGVIYRHHFVGGAEMGRTTSATNLKTVLNLPASKELRDQLVQKLSKAPREFWRKEIPTDAPDGAEFFRPLLEDLFSAESHLEVRGPAKRPESVLAVKLDAQRAQVWSTNLWKLLSAWKLGTPAGLAGGGPSGWEWKSKSGSRLVRFVHSGEWVLVGLGEENLGSLPGLIEKVGKSGRPVPVLTNSWLALETDWARLSQWFPLMAKYKLPVVQLTVSPFEEYVRTEARLRYSEAIPWRYEPWKIPTNTISDPIISFTVARGIAPLLSQSPVIRDLGIKDPPNQFCLWGQAHTFPVTYLTMPMKGATNLVTQLAVSLPKVVDTYLTNHAGGFLLVSNRSELIWEGLALILPRLRPITDGPLEYLVAATFPLLSKKSSIPSELFTQFIGRTNLVYYDWEITGERLRQVTQLVQFYNMANLWKSPGTNAPTQKWLDAAAGRLGNTVTEVTVTSPNELSLVRKSHVGFSGFELASLARWIESDGFPLRYAPPPPWRERRGPVPPRGTNSLSRSNSVRKATPSPAPKKP